METIPTKSVEAWNHFFLKLASIFKDGMMHAVRWKKLNYYLSKCMALCGQESVKLSQTTLMVKSLFAMQGHVGVIVLEGPL